MKMPKYLNKRIFVCLSLALVILIVASFVASSVGDQGTGGIGIDLFYQDPPGPVTKRTPINFSWVVIQPGPPFLSPYLNGTYCLRIERPHPKEKEDIEIKYQIGSTKKFSGFYNWTVPGDEPKGEHIASIRVPCEDDLIHAHTKFKVVPTVLVIQKFDDSNQNNRIDGGDKGLQGWEFKVKYPDGNTKSYSTEFKGEKRIEVLDEYAGKDLAVEEILQPGWESILPVKQTVKIPKGKTTTVQFLNHPTPTELIIQKFDDSNQNSRIDGNDKRLQGWEFKVIDPDRNTKTYTTNIKGEIVIEVPPEYGGKEYNIEEILRPGWKSILPVKQPVKVPVPDNKTTTVQFLNSYDTKLIIQKFDDSNRNNEIDSNDDERLQGWEFKVTDPDGNTKPYSTNIKGEIEIKVPPEYGGKEYNIEEILRPGWKSILPVNQPVKVPVPEGKTTPVQFLNVYATKLIIQKFSDTNQNNRIDSSDNSLKNWSFNITDPAGKTSTHITNDAGEIRIVVPEEYAGKEYTIEETLQPKWKLVLPIEQPVHVKVPMGETKIVQFLNNRSITRLRIQKFSDINRNDKIDNNDAIIRDWEFKVTDPTGNTKTYFTNNEDDEILINVPEEYAGKEYTVEEILKDGWKAITPTKQTKNVPENKTTTVQFLNNESITRLRIQKFYDANQNGEVDSEDERLQDWEFKVTNPAGKTTTHNTNNIGEIEIKVPREYEGKGYVVEEILKPKWVAVLPIEQRVNVPKGKTTTVNFLNKVDTGNLRIIKFCDHNQNGVKDPKDQGLAWNFSIKFPDGSAKRIRTYKNGSYLLPNITVGDYEITEEPRGCRWTNSTDMTQKVEVTGGQETIAKFRNYIAECCILPGCVWKNRDENIEVCKSVDPCSVALGKEEEEEVTVHLGLCVDPKHIINGTKVENISVIDTLHSQFTIVDGSFSEEPNAKRRNPDDTTTITWDIPSLCCEEWNVSFNVTVAFALPIDVTDTSERVTSKVIYDDLIETGRRELSIPEGMLKFRFIVTPPPPPPRWCYLLGGLLLLSIVIQIMLELKRRKKEKPKEKE